MPKGCVAADCSNERDVEEDISLHKLPFYGDDRPARSKEKEQEMGGFCSAEASEMGTIPVFSAVLSAF